MNNCLRIGCRARVLTNDGEFEGTIHSFDVQLGFIAMKNVLCLKSQKKFPSIINFMKNEIRKLTILSEPKAKKKRALTGGVQPHAANKTVESSSSSSAQSLQNIIPVTSEKIAKTKPIAPVSVPNRPRVEIQSTEQALLGGIPSQYYETGSQCLVEGAGQNVTSDYVLLEEASDEFYLAINKISVTTVVGVAMEGVNLGRNGQLSWIMIGTKHHVFLFDVLLFGEDVLIGVLKTVFENENILKVVHDCRSISDLLFHRYGVGFINVFDTQVASVILHQKNYGRLPKSVDSLVVCIQKTLNLPDEVIYTQKALDHSFKSNPNVWNIRPATDNVFQAAVFTVRYLRELRLRLMEKMMADFINGVDIYLGVLRDASESQLQHLQNRSHMVPREFQNIQSNADASRRRMEQMYNREPDDHRMIGSLATVDKFIASDDRRQEVHREKNMKPSSPEPTTNPWTNDYDFTDASTNESSGVRPKEEEGENDVRGHDLDEPAIELSLDDVVRIQAAIAPKSDDFIFVAAGSESTQLDKEQLEKKAKRLAAGKLFDSDLENPVGVTERPIRIRSHSRCVPVFDDVSIIPSSSDPPMFYLGRCTTDGFTTSSDDSTRGGDDAKCGEKVALGARDDRSGEAGVASGNHQVGYEDFLVSKNRSDGGTSSSDEGIRESFAKSNAPSFVPMGRGAFVMKLLGLQELPKPGIHKAMSSPKCLSNY